MVVVLGEESVRKTSVNALETQAILEAARIFGCRVFMMPADFSQCETAENALAYVPDFEPSVLGIWVGYIPTLEHYTAIYQAALLKGVKLINSPAEHQMAMEFDHFYPHLRDITPRSIIVESKPQLEQQATMLKFPLFVKGAVKSNKEQGYKAVVAENLDELRKLAAEVLASAYRSRGKVILRELVPLRRVDLAPDGFPMSREYRIFVHHQEIVAYSFYWDQFEEAEPLTSLERQAMLNLALEAAARLKVPFIAVDVGQLESGDWIVIETGDAQFCGLSHVPVLELWGKIKDFA